MSANDNNISNNNKNSDFIEKIEDEKIFPKDSITLSEAQEMLSRSLLIQEKLKKNSLYSKCTYNKGYITQEVSICLTCFSETKKHSVICSACSFHCHEDHEILQIGYKRNVRCDCGNSHFNTQCNLIKDKEYENYGNIYGHNYEGKYCFCNEEDNAERTMTQCFICEDWFCEEHSDIYNLKKEELPEFGDFICRNCVGKIKKILEGYDIKNYLVNDEYVDNVKKEEKEDKKNDEENNINNENNNNENNNNENNINNENDNKEFHINYKKRKSNDPKSPEDQTEKLIDNIKNKCNYKLNIETQKTLELIIENKKDLFFMFSEFLKILCHCEKCNNLYKELNLEYFSNKDLYSDWEHRILLEDRINKDLDINSEENKKILADIESRENKMLNSLSFEQQVQYSIYNKMLEKFTEFIKNKEKENKEKNPNVKNDFIITENVVKEFLANFKKEFIDK